MNEAAPHAVESHRKWGVPVSVILAQAILESGWGRKNLGVHNYFGITGKGPAGAVYADTLEYVGEGETEYQRRTFRAYVSMAQAFDDHGRLLGTSRYYATARAALPDVRAFCKSLTGVYATDPVYGEKLIALIDQYELDKYDTELTA